MILKIVFAVHEEFFECDHLEVLQQKETGLMPDQFHAFLYFKGDMKEVFFSRGYLMENGKTVECFVIHPQVKGN